MSHLAIVTQEQALEAWERVLARVEPGPDGCLLWTGAVNSKGYGCIGIGGVSVLIHRLAVLVRDGEIDDELPVDHTCHDPAVCPTETCVHHRCANPEHLEQVTTAENSRRGAMQNRTVCKRNHPLTVRHRAGKPVRCCRVCERERRRPAVVGT